MPALLRMEPGCGSDPSGSGRLCPRSAPRPAALVGGDRRTPCEGSRPAPSLGVFSRRSFYGMLHPPVRRRPEAARPLGAGLSGSSPCAGGWCSSGFFAGMNSAQASPWSGSGSFRGCWDTSVDVRRCRKTSPFSVLFGKFGELPKPAGLGDQKHCCREAAEPRAGAAVPGDSPERLQRLFRPAKGSVRAAPWGCLAPRVAVGVSVGQSPAKAVPDLARANLHLVWAV